MDSASALRSFHLGAASSMTYTQSLIEKHGVMLPMHIAGSKKSLSMNGRIGLVLLVRKGGSMKCVQAVKTKTATLMSDVSSDNTQEEPLEKKTLSGATFPNGIEALILEVCDETEIAELKLKVGGFEINLRRNLGATVAAAPLVSLSVPPEIPSQPVAQSAPVSLPTSPSKSTSVTTAGQGKSQNLMALEASGTSGYVLVSSTSVGSFSRGRIVKGTKRPPVCKEGARIKEGQIIGYVDQCGSTVPVKSDVDGEIFKFLSNDGDAIGYGDPILAVLPSFHGIR